MGVMGALAIAVTAQEFTGSAENPSVNLRVRYPENWSGEAIPDFGFVLQDFEGWTLSIGIGEVITSSFVDVPDAAPNMPAAAAILEIAKLLDPDSYNLDEVDTVTLPQGEALRLSGTVTEEGVTVPVVILTFNLPPDGRLVVATLFNEQTLDVVTPSVYTDYEEIVGTIEAFSVAVPPIGELPTGGPVAIADMPPNTLVFETGASVTFPEGWAIYVQEPTITTTAVLFKGESYFNTGVIVAITVYSLSDVPIEFVDAFMMPMLAPLYTGRDDFDAERDIIASTLTDGRFFRYLDISNAENSFGNIYLVQVDETSYLMLLATVTIDDPAALAEVELIARSATSAPVVIGQGGPSDPEPTETPAAVAVPDLPVTQVQCRTSAFDLTFDPATQQAIVECPANCSGSVWGTDVYTADSSICVAAAHAGVISQAAGGRVLVTSLPGQDSYAGTARNGITTSNWGSYRASFSVAPAGSASSAPQPSPTSAAPSLNVRELGLQPQQATCDLRISTDVVNESSVYALFECPAGCDQEYYAVWGTDVYTGDSYLCAAAIHAGAISSTGGLVLVTWQPGREQYSDSERNGIISASWGSWGDSFITQGVDAATGQTR
jgi:hypothetical protein